MKGRVRLLVLDSTHEEEEPDSSVEQIVLDLDILEDHLMSFVAEVFLPLLEPSYPRLCKQSSREGASDFTTLADVATPFHLLLPADSRSLPGSWPLR